ncbi:hypothetical protein BU17DRAFT_35666, partial [Hysterangium stoloniferum]
AESVRVISGYGIQLETHRGFQPPLLPIIHFTSTRRFVPSRFIQDVVINEGLSRWNVRYYICIIKDTGRQVTLEVAFEVSRSYPCQAYTECTRIFCPVSQF